MLLILPCGVSELVLDDMMILCVGGLLVVVVVLSWKVV